MYAYKIILFYAFLISIGHAANNNYFFRTTQLRWSGAVKIITNINYNFNQDIREPRGTRIAVAEILFTDSLFKLHKDCLVYKTPVNENGGSLRVIQVKLKDDCSDFLFKKEVVIINDIYNFGFSVQDRNLILRIDAQSLSYKLFNLTLAQEYKLNQRPRENTRIQGAFVSFYDPQGENDSGELLSDGDVCFDVDDRCNVVHPDVCNFCPDGVMVVKSNQCAHAYRKVCTKKACGQQGGFACVRGNRASQYGGPYCIVDSPWAFCRKPNRVYCENKILVCR